MHEQVRRWIVDVLEVHRRLLTIAFRQRAKFEGWLKFELAACAELADFTSSVCVEASPEDQAVVTRCRSDLSFRVGTARYDVELKTPNANWRLPGVDNLTRPITKNIAEIIDDARKLASSADHGIVAFVLFPIPSGDLRWQEYLERISKSLDIPLSPAEHTVQLTFPVAGEHVADAVVCCFEVPSRRDRFVGTDDDFLKPGEKLVEIPSDSDDRVFTGEAVGADVNECPQASEPLRLVLANFGNRAEATQRVSLDKSVALLETVGGHLEGNRGGSRFPLLWRLAPALLEDASYRWSGEELGALFREVDTIERETEALPATMAPSIAFGDEGYSEVYSRETPGALGTVRSAFQSFLDQIRGCAAEAERTKRDLLIVREGPACQWWDR